MKSDVLVRCTEWINMPEGGVLCICLHGEDYEIKKGRDELTVDHNGIIRVVAENPDQGTPALLLLDPESIEALEFYNDGVSSKGDDV